jgi:signal transduction histidine kinase/CheY-like chemotaxis protein
MGVVAVVNRLTRLLGNRGFASRSLENEFQATYRSYGVRFLFLSTSLTALCYVGFLVFDAVIAQRSWTSPVQLARVTQITLMTLVALATLQFKDALRRHYAPACSALIVAGTLMGAQVNLQGHTSAEPITLYWALTTTAVLGTLMLYGFARLNLFNTLALGLFIGWTSLYSAAVHGPDDLRALHRMCTHILAANALGLCLYRFSLGRERKLFLQSRRKNHMAELRRMKEQAEAASRAKTAFLANMSHEIRTPMNGVIGALSMLNEQNLPERDRLFVKSARDSARHLLHLLDEILDFAKLNAQKVRLSPLPFDPRDTVVAACEAFRATAEQKGIALRGDTRGVPADVRQLTADEGKLRQVLLNLVSNAVKFTQHGEVVVSLAVRPEDAHMATLVIDVSDTGVGIPESAIDQLCQPFFQVESGSNRSHGGTGLGLAICKQIVEEMGGSISVRSVQGVGTTFEIRIGLPYSSEPLPTASPASTPGPQPAEATPPPEDLRLQGHVLLVEDNEVNAFIASMTLESLGVTCRQARNGEVAVALFREEAFDVVLMDCEMPVMDGYEAARQMRALEADDTARPRTPIVALTAHALSGDREVCLSRGMDDYLTKPFDRHTLALALSRWLSAGSMARA